MLHVERLEPRHAPALVDWSTVIIVEVVFPPVQPPAPSVFTRPPIPADVQLPLPGMKPPLGNILFPGGRELLPPPAEGGRP